MPKGLGKGYEQLIDEDKHNIVTMFKSGKTYKEICNTIPCTRRAVPKVMSEYNIQTHRKNRYTLDETYFLSDITERKAYWLGLISADGCITNTNYFVLQLSGEDHYLLSHFKDDINYTGEIYIPKYKEPRQTIYRINFSSKIMCNSLRDLGILENKLASRNMIPNIPEKMIRHYMRGYFDGDGTFIIGKSSYTRNNKDYVYPSYHISIAMTYPLAQEWSEYLKQQIKYDAKIHRSKCNQICYVCVFQKQALRALYDLLYQNASIYMARKHDKWLQFLSAYSE